ncbi:MAG: hypothetical protein IT291_05665 [Deltaproteobacteria bacterium]|nr:hypothetical protein [Deltaproteobacteria bacterium]
MDLKLVASLLRHAFALLTFSLFISLCAASPAAAQIAVTVGAQELYDSNVFLENETGQPIPLLDGDGLPIALPKSADGKKNDDLISNLHLGLSGAIPIHETIKAGLEGEVGSLFFADESDESRLTADTHLKVESTELLIPNPFFIALTSDLTSDSQNVAIAQGSSARVSQSHDATLTAGIGNIQIIDKTDFGLHYGLTRHDFLGEFLFSDRSPDELEEEGSDYVSNSLTTVLTHHTTERLDTEVYAGVDYLKFTSVKTNDIIGKSADDIDRTIANLGIGCRYAFSDKLNLFAGVGGDLSFLSEDPEPRTDAIIDDSGNTILIATERDDEESSLAFNAGADFMPRVGTIFSLAVDQSKLIDIDGDNILSRTFSLNGLHKIGEAWQLSASGLFTQFDEGDSLSDATDRFEVTTSVRYFITEALAIAVGWNYSNQDADTGSDNFLSLGTDDYKIHRAFISLDFGLVGTSMI